MQEIQTAEFLRHNVKSEDQNKVFQDDWQHSMLMLFVPQDFGRTYMEPALRAMQLRGLDLCCKR